LNSGESRGPGSVEEKNGISQGCSSVQPLLSTLGGTNEQMLTFWVLGIVVFWSLSIDIKLFDLQILLTLYLVLEKYLHTEYT
jgi:hypothetical protein